MDKIQRKMLEQVYLITPSARSVIAILPAK